MSELRIERLYPIAPEDLFDYLTRPANVVKWWGPEGTTVVDAALDLAKVGPWRLLLETPRGGFEMSGTVIRVIRPALVELTMTVPGEDTESIVRFELAAEGEGSRLTLIQSGISDEMVEMGRRGWGSTLSRLERLLGFEPAADSPE